MRGSTSAKTMKTKKAEIQISSANKGAFYVAGILEDECPVRINSILSWQCCLNSPRGEECRANCATEFLHQERHRL